MRGRKVLLFRPFGFSQHFFRVGMEQQSIGRDRQAGEWDDSRFVSCCRASISAILLFQGVMDQQKTGELLKALRKQRGLTQEQVAETARKKALCLFRTGKHTEETAIKMPGKRQLAPAQAAGKGESGKIGTPSTALVDLEPLQLNNCRGAWAWENRQENRERAFLQAPSFTPDAHG